MRIPTPRSKKTVIGGGGVSLAVQEWGKVDGFPIIFIHAFSQSHLSWIQQVAGRLSIQFNLITFDIRGHGNSAKPEGIKYYSNGDLLADDVQAVIEACGLIRPIVVAWSIGGVILGDYLAKYGDSQLSGIVYIGAAHQLRTNPSYVGPAFGHSAAGMLSDDLATNVLATIEAGRLVTAERTDPSTFTFVIATNMVVPTYVRVGIMSRSVDHIKDTLPALSIPIYFIHGREDQIIIPAASEAAFAATKNGRVLLLEGVGHAPHVEAAEQVAAEIIQLVSEVSEVRVL